MAGNLPSLGVRFRSGLIYVVVSCICILVNDWAFAIYLAIVSGICAAEFFQMMHKDHKITNDALGIVASALYPLAMKIWGLSGVALITVLYVMLLIVWFVYFMRARVPDMGVSFFAAGYTGMMLSRLVLIRQALEHPWGGVLVLLLFASIWFNDAGA